VIKKPRTGGGYSPARGLQNTNPKWVELLNVTSEMQLLKTLLLSLLYMFHSLLAHHQELTETVGAAYSDGMRYLINLI